MKKILVFLFFVICAAGRYNPAYSQSGNQNPERILLFGPEYLKNLRNSGLLTDDLILTHIAYKAEIGSSLLEQGVTEEKELSVSEEDNDIENTDKGNFLEAIQLFEEMKFKKALKLFAKIHNNHPSDILVQYYLSLSQLYCGFYSPAIENFSKLNKTLSLSGKEINPEFLADVKFYFAISSMTLKDDHRISKILFNQLNQNGGKYEVIAKGMCAML